MTAKKSRIKVALLLPTLNEAATITGLLKDILALEIRDVDLRIYVIDSGSTDETLSKVKKMKSSGKVHLLTCPVRGLALAYKTGYEFLMHEWNPDLFVQMDADRSHDHRMIPVFIDKVKHLDILAGSRYIKGGSVDSQWPFRRYFFSKVVNRLVVLLFKMDDLTDVTSGFRIIRRECIEDVIKDVSDVSGYAFQFSIILAAVKKSFRCGEVPIYFAERKGGSSKMRFFDVVEFFYIVFKRWVKLIVKGKL